MVLNSQSFTEIDRTICEEKQTEPLKKSVLVTGVTHTTKVILYYIQTLDSTFTSMLQNLTIMISNDIIITSADILKNQLLRDTSCFCINLQILTKFYLNTYEEKWIVPREETKDGNKGTKQLV